MYFSGAITCKHSSTFSTNSDSAHSITWVCFESVCVSCCFCLILGGFFFFFFVFFYYCILNLKLSHSSIKMSLFSFWLAQKWLDTTFILLWPYTLNSLEVVFVGMLSKLNIEKASKILKRFFCVSFGHAMDCFFYLLVYLQITSL